MLPWSDDFRWEAWHMMFILFFIGVFSLVAWTVVTALRRMVSDFREKKNETIWWSETFSNLSIRARTCRHELTGEIENRTCPNGFDCRSCQFHDEFVRSAGPQTESAEAAESVAGIAIPLDRLYHRGHTWVKVDRDGTVLVGLDELGRRMVGTPDKVDLPEPGTVLRANGIGWRITRKRAVATILSPVDGEVVEVGGPSKEWYLRLRPRGNLRHLLYGQEVRAWFLHELERLQATLSTGGVGTTMADGGTLVADLPAMLPGRCNDLWEEMFLQP